MQLLQMELETISDTLIVFLYTSLFGKHFFCMESVQKEIANIHFF